MLTIGSVGWIVTLALATFIASRSTVGIAAYGFSAAIYQMGSLVCHQLSERSFHVWGAQLPVCARCTGLYTGAAAAAIAAMRLNDRTRYEFWTHAKTLVLVAAAPTVITLVHEWVSGQMPSHWVRAAAGFPLGVAVMLVVLAGTAPESVVEIH
jgi:uncharacterized membrane protein